MVQKKMGLKGKHYLELFCHSSTLNYLQNIVHGAKSILISGLYVIQWVAHHRKHISQ